MNFIGKTALVGLSTAAMGITTGCVVRVHDEPPRPGPVVVYDEPGTVVYDDYYYRGYYDGPYFFWYGRDGRLFHEMREDHERRERFEHRGHAEERHDTAERHRYEQQRSAHPQARPQERGEHEREHEERR